MHLLYLDDAGAPANPNERHFILAGIALFERQTHWLQTELDNLAQEIVGGDASSIEFHGNPILGGKRRWRRLPRSERRSLILRALAAAPHSLRGDWRLFGVVVDKQARSPEDPVAYAFEQLCSRFDLFLKRLYATREDAQRGLIILDKSAEETRLQSMASGFKTEGHRWGMMRNLAEVPLFVDSRATRLIQYADLVAYALWRKFEKQDDDFFNAIAEFFDQEGGIIHGLHHFKAPSEPCNCPACLRPRSQFSLQ